MRSNRLGCLTGTGFIAALITVIALAGVGFFSGGAMFSPGKLNAETGSILGGVSSHAEIAGECKVCHTAPWESEGMDNRCNACHTNIPPELEDLGSIRSITGLMRCSQ